MSPRFCSLPAPSLLCCKEEGLRERNPRETDRTWSNHITLKVFIWKLYWIKSLSLIKRVGRHTVLSLVLPRGGCLLELRKELPYFGLGVRLSSHAANQLHSKLCNSILENYFLLFLFFFLQHNSPSSDDSSDYSHDSDIERTERSHKKSSSSSYRDYDSSFSQVVFF